MCPIFVNLLKDGPVFCLCRVKTIAKESGRKSENWDVAEMKNENERETARGRDENGSEKGRLRNASWRRGPEAGQGQGKGHRQERGWFFEFGGSKLPCVLHICNQRLYASFLGFTVGRGSEKGIGKGRWESKKTRKKCTKDANWSARCGRKKQPTKRWEGTPLSFRSLLNSVIFRFGFRTSCNCSKYLLLVWLSRCWKNGSLESGRKPGNMKRRKSERKIENLKR